MEKREIITERTVIIETLKKYRKLHYLWNPTHKLYSSKNARRQGLEILLKSWRKLEPRATIACMKKKLNNWRASYRRERKKIVDSMRTALEPDEIHKPNLWYYDYLSFINDDCPVLGKDCDDTLEIDTANDHDIDDNVGEAVEEFEEETNAEIEDNTVDQEETDSDEEPLKKKSVSAKQKSQDQSSKQESLIMEPPQVLIQSNITNDENSEDLFGRAIGSQLKELSKFQRCIAEKLISDIMFYAKLEQLTLGTSIHLDSTDP